MWEILAIYNLLPLLSVLPLLFYLVDGYYDKNLKKGVLYICGFLLLMCVTVFCIYKIGFYIAILFPVLFIVFLLFSRQNK